MNFEELAIQIEEEENKRIELREKNLEYLREKCFYLIDKIEEYDFYNTICNLGFLEHRTRYLPINNLVRRSEFSGLDYKYIVNGDENGDKIYIYLSGYCSLFRCKNATLENANDVQLEGYIKNMVLILNHIDEIYKDIEEGAKKLIGNMKEANNETEEKLKKCKNEKNKYIINIL